MKYRSIKLDKGQYLSHVEPFKSNGIPNNSIIHKTITGCGITTYAIEHFKQHCIIILPNVPVITSKRDDHNDKFPNEEVLAVYKDTDVDDIEVYLLRDIPFKKILTTPEGFIKKVLKAFENDLSTLYSQYFLLLDECERVITDISYRGAIAAPFDVFFDFENRAMVSATTLPFSGELLQDLDHYVIEPTFDYSKPINLITTNNILASLKSYLDTIPNEQVCIFFNSTEGINSVIGGLDIKENSVVFCAQKSVSKLLTMKYKNATSDFMIKDMKTNNLFTSRYFSAFDIILEAQPHVIIISDLFAAEHSVIDPQTEAIQIAGRFRKGFKSLTHIANFKSSIEALEQPEALIYLEGSLHVHEKIVKMLIKDKQKASVDMLKFFNKKSPMASFYTNGKRNPFMIDNALHEHRVQGYYKEPNRLIQAYAACDKHFDVTHMEETYPVSDENLFNLKSNQSKKEQMKEAARLIDVLAPKPHAPGIMMTFRPVYMDELRNSLVDLYPYLPEAIALIGLSGLEQTGYVKSAITKAVSRQKRINADLKFAPYVQEAFKYIVLPPESEIKQKLNELAELYNYPYAITASIMERFFKNAKRTQSGRVNCWKWDGPIDFTSIQE